METATGYPYETTTKDSVNLREKKSTSAGLIRQIPQGATITILAVSGDYAQVEYKGEYLGIREMRKHVAWDTAGLPHSSALRNEVNQVESYEDFKALIMHKI